LIEADGYSHLYALLASLPDSDASHLFALHRDSSSTFVQGKTEGTAPSFNNCTQFKITWQEVLGKTENISYRSKIGISPFHKYFPLFRSFFIWLVRRKLSRGNDKLGQFLLRLLEFAAVQHLCPALFLFLTTFVPDKLL